MVGFTDEQMRHLQALQQQQREEAASLESLGHDYQEERSGAEGVRGGERGNQCTVSQYFERRLKLLDE